ncbi:uncharacterized protein LOC127587467 [Pristis pectinata]|uniref:uncharacterized protein LOC127587467 n=1 Tax=Pristis pectinata TaxID=685728 RepID=UPI00223CEC0D|nr:uncharacterized protein LOC127587467 [Pristis pectinata]
MRLATLAFLLAQPALFGATPAAVQEESVLKLVEGEKAPGGSGALALITSPCPATTSSQPSSSQPSVPTTIMSTIQSSDQSTVMSTVLSSSSESSSTQSTSTQTTTIKLQALAHIVLSSSTHIAAGSPDAAVARDTDAPVSVDNGAEIVVINSNGTETESTVPIVLRVGDEIIIASSDTGANDTLMPILLGGDGDGAEIIITNSEESGNSSLTPIVLNKGDEIIVATSNGTKTESASSLVLGNGSEIKITGSENGNNSVILANGTEVITNHYSDTDALDDQVVTTESANAENMMVTTLNEIAENVVTNEKEDKDSGIVAEEHGTQVAVENKVEVTETSEPQTIVISLDSSSYSWARWSAWYCNCLNSSMSRIRGIMDKKTGITLHSSDYQPSNFQRKPCNYKVCDCSRQDKQCHLTNVTCLEANPYTCVLNDIAYQEVLDSKDYWRKLKKGVQALYHKIKTFLQRITKEET